MIAMHRDIPTGLGCALACCPGLCVIACIATASCNGQNLIICSILVLGIAIMMMMRRRRRK